MGAKSDNVCLFSAVFGVFTPDLLMEYRYRIWNIECGETSNFSTSVTFRNIKFLHITDFSPQTYWWNVYTQKQ